MATTPPPWATDTAGASIVVPPAAKQAQGWLPNEQPPASWFNWWQRDVYRCLVEQSARLSKLQLNAVLTLLASTPVTGANVPSTSYSFDPVSGQHCVGTGLTNAYVSFVKPNGLGGSTNQPGAGGLTELYYDGQYVQGIGMSSAAIFSSPAAQSTLTWTTRLASARAYGTIAASQQQSTNIRVAIAASSGHVARSTDGLAWTETLQTGSFAGALQRIVIWDPGRSRFFMAAGDGTAWQSVDGTSWNALAAHGMLATSMISAVYYAPMDAIVLCGSGSTRAVKFSTDGGLTWQDTGLNIGSSGVWEVFNVADVAVFVRGVTQQWYYSVDLLNWLPLTLPGISTTPTGTVRGRYRFFYMPEIGLGQMYYVNDSNQQVNTRQVVL